MKDLRPMRNQRLIPYRVLLPSVLAATFLAEPVAHAQTAPTNGGAREFSGSQAEGMAWLIDGNLQHDPGSPVLGNPQGDVTLVEFFDYRCPYCKIMAPVVAALIASDAQLRVVMKEYPVLSSQSIVAAKNGKYAAFHSAMFALKGPFDEPRILSVAQSVGLDPARVRQEMNAPEIATELQINIALGKALDFRGTPTFLVDGHIIAGAVAAGELRKLIAAARTKD